MNYDIHCVHKKNFTVRFWTISPSHCLLLSAVYRIQDIFMESDRIKCIRYWTEQYKLTLFTLYLVWFHENILCAIDSTLPRILWWCISQFTAILPLCQLICTAAQLICTVEHLIWPHHLICHKKIALIDASHAVSKLILAHKIYQTIPNQTWWLGTLRRHPYSSSK